MCSVPRTQTFEELERTNSELRHRNKELSQQIVEFIRTEAKLRQANADLGLFAFSVSHDLQEPVRTVTSCSDLLHKRTQGKLEPDVEDLIRVILGAVSRMRSLVEGLLAYTRLGQDNGSTLVTVSLRDVLANTLADLEWPIREHSVSVNCEWLPTVNGDEALLTMLLENLIGNAIKYRRPEVAPVVHISAERGNGEWLISVRDNAEGFEAMYAEQIFEVFKRLHGIEVPGTGIGLAVCRRIVERHRGRIWATSNPGEGSTFFFTLPRV